jgi:hypothetical protein
MKVSDENTGPAFLREEEMRQIVSSQQDPITAQLMGLAYHTLLVRMLRQESLPVADFDLRFFMEVIQEFCSDQETLKKVLAGEKLPAWYSDEDER